MPKSDGYVIDWFKPLELKGDFAAETLDSYFQTAGERLKDDMAFLRGPIRKWRGRSWWLRVTAFVLLALGVILPLPIIRIEGEGPSGLDLGYFAILLGGLILFFDQVFAISSSWMRLSLAEMQVKQIRYRLELDWARRRPLLTNDNASTEGPALIDILKTAADTAHDVMETQKEAWNNEIRQGIEALRSRLNDDRIALEKLRTEQLQEQARPKVGAVNITIDKPGDLKGPLEVKVSGQVKLRLNDEVVPANVSVKDVPAGLQTITVSATRSAPPHAPFLHMVSETIPTGDAKSMAVAVA